MQEREEKIEQISKSLEELTQKIDSLATNLDLRFIERIEDQISSFQDSVIHLTEKIDMLKDFIKGLGEDKKPNLIEPQNKIEIRTPLDSLAILELPKHLQKTYMQLLSLNRDGTMGCTAADVATKTQKARAVESDYLNQLCVLGIVEKKRKGRTVIFYGKGSV